MRAPTLQRYNDNHGLVGTAERKKALKIRERRRSNELERMWMLEKIRGVGVTDSISFQMELDYYEDSKNFKVQQRKFKRMGQVAVNCIDW